MALGKRVKVKEGEILTEANIKHVITLLEDPVKKLTKKQACEILNISYNTTRLDSIIQNYKDDRARTLELRAKNRGKPPSDSDIAYCIKSYLEGAPITDIAKSLYRPAYFVKNILTSRNVPIRNPSATFFDYVELVPEEAISQTFEVGETVYSMRYQTLAKVHGIFIDGLKQTVYRLFLLEEDSQSFAYQPWWEIASLKHLQKYGVTF